MTHIGKRSEDWNQAAEFHCVIFKVKTLIACFVSPRIGSQHVVVVRLPVHSQTDWQPTFSKIELWYIGTTSRIQSEYTKIRLAFSHSTYWAKIKKNLIYSNNIRVHTLRSRVHLSTSHQRRVSRKPNQVSRTSRKHVCQIDWRVFV